MTSKKNWTMRAAVLMLALVLITSCFVGGTFAKYVTSGSGTDSARVAKFGVTVSANGDVFAKEYDTDDQTVVGTIAKSVISTDKVVAPGTTSNGDFVAATITGTPEVAVRVSYKLDAATLQLENWKDCRRQILLPSGIQDQDSGRQSGNYRYRLYIGRSYEGCSCKCRCGIYQGLCSRHRSFRVRLPTLLRFPGNGLSKQVQTLTSLQTMKKTLS